MGIKELAKEAGVSTTTAWRALNQAPDINSDTRARILETAARLGYRANRAASALVTGRSQSVALWMPVLSSPHAAHVLYYAQREISRHEFEMMVRSREIYSCLDAPSLLQWPVDGILAYDVIDVVDRLRTLLAARQGGHVPIVSMGPYYDGRVDAVGVDLGVGAAQAVRHLVEQGCRHVAYLVDETFGSEQDARYAGYVRGARETGVECQVLKAPNAERKTVAAFVERYFAVHKGEIDGLFCFSDEFAIGAYRGLRNLDVKIPDEVALVGCDGIEDTEYVDCPLSTLIQPIEKMCALAWKFLDARMRKPEMERQFSLLLPTLAVRASSTRRQHAL
jgi:LacI family transcriptional regulator